MSDDTSKIGANLEHELSEAGWTVVAWAADVYDTLQYSFKRRDPQGEILFVLTFTEASTTITHMRAERWLYGADEPEVDVVADRMILAAATPYEVEPFLKEALANWDASAVHGLRPYADRDVAQSITHSADSLRNIPDIAEAERRQEFLRAEGVVELERLGVAMYMRLRKEERRSERTSTSGRGSSPRPRTVIGMNDRNLIFVASTVTVSVVWSVVLFGQFAPVIRLPTAVAAACAFVIACVGVTAFAVVGRVVAERRLRAYSPALNSVLLASGAFGALLVTATLVAVTAIYNREVEIVAAVVTSVVDVLVLTGAAVGGYADRAEEIRHDFERLHANDQRRASVRKEFLERAKQVQAENIRTRMSVLLDDERAPSIFLYSIDKQIFTNPPLATWQLEAERALSTDREYPRFGLPWRDRTLESRKSEF